VASKIPGTRDRLHRPEQIDCIARSRWPSSGAEYSTGSHIPMKTGSGCPSQALRTPPAYARLRGCSPARRRLLGSAVDLECNEFRLF
jgi:hypothetical protein